MVRVMMLAPFLIALSAWLGRGAGRHPAGRRAATLSIPWFAVAFVGVVLFNSLGLLSARTLEVATWMDTLLLAMAMAMAASGLTTQLSALRAAGPEPLCVGAVLLVWLIGGGAATNFAITSYGCTRIVGEVGAVRVRPQSAARSNSLMEVLARVCASTFLTITAQ
jgi:uncharacterized integral membrane protein (TIGR00698 family)